MMINKKISWGPTGANTGHERTAEVRKTLQDQRTAGAGAKKVFVPQISCAAFCDPFNMLPLSAIDDTRRVTGRRHREEGRRDNSNKFKARTRTVQLFESVSFE
jgi:hypothetical protein